MKRKPVPCCDSMRLALGRKAIYLKWGNKVVVSDHCSIYKYGRRGVWQPGEVILDCPYCNQNLLKEFVMMP